MKLSVTVRTQPPNFIIFLGLFTYIVGVCMMLVSDAQKYYRYGCDVVLSAIDTTIALVAHAAYFLFAA